MMSAAIRAINAIATRMPMIHPHGVSLLLVAGVGATVVVVVDEVVEVLVLVEVLVDVLVVVGASVVGGVVVVGAAVVGGVVVAGTVVVCAVAAVSINAPTATTANNNTGAATIASRLRRERGWKARMPITSDRNLVRRDTAPV
jgi:hypothetical protein